MDEISKKKGIRTKIMKAVKAKGSKIEVKLMKALWQRGLRYRKHVKGLTGTPDIVFLNKKVAVFCDSEFWHGKDWEIKKHDIKSRKEFWYKKIERNIEKDKEVNANLTRDGWKVIRFWGKSIEKEVEICVDIVENALKGESIEKPPPH